MLAFFLNRIGKIRESVKMHLFAHVTLGREKQQSPGPPRDENGLILLSEMSHDERESEVK